MSEPQATDAIRVIVLGTGGYLYVGPAESHEKIAKALFLRDRLLQRDRFLRVALVPRDVADPPEQWRMTWDKKNEPSWWDEDRRRDTRLYLEMKARQRHGKAKDTTGEG